MTSFLLLTFFQCRRQSLIERPDFDDFNSLWVRLALADCPRHDGGFETEFLRLAQPRHHLTGHSQLASQTDFANQDRIVLND